MTRRERLERKVELREEWSEKARVRSDQRFESARQIADRIPMGQPILVGHHSERRHRRDADKIHTNMDRGVEEHRLAEHHDAKRRGLELQLEHTIFDDDADAIDRLEERIRDREESAKYNVEINKAWRKGGVPALLAIGVSEALANTLAETMKQCPWLKAPCDSSHDRAAIRRDKERIAIIRRKRERAEKAEASPSGVLIEGGDYVTVTFPEKPAREVLAALRSAGFRWGQGSWHGRRDALPELVASCAEAPADDFARASS